MLVLALLLCLRKSNDSLVRMIEYCTDWTVAVMKIQGLGDNVYVSINPSNTPNVFLQCDMKEALQCGVKDNWFRLERNLHETVCKQMWLN